MGRPFDPARIHLVEQMLADANPRAVVEDRVMKAWGVSRRVVRRYIAAVEKLWTLRAGQSPDDWRAQLTEMALGRYRKAVAADHGNVALKAIELVAKLQGVTKVDVLGIVGTYDPRGAFTSNEAIQTRLAELRQQQLAALGPGKDDDEDKGGGDN